MDNIKIAEFLLARRKEKGITQSDLADKMGVTYQAVSRWEKGDSIPDLDTLDHLADFYGVTVDEILCRETVTQDVVTEKTSRMPSLFLIYTILLFVSTIILYVSLLAGAEVAGDSGIILMAIGIVQYIIVLFGSTAFLQYYFFHHIENRKNRSDFQWYFRANRILIAFIFIALFTTISTMGSLFILIAVILILIEKFHEHNLLKNDFDDKSSYFSKFIPKSIVNQVLTGIVALSLVFGMKMMLSIQGFLVILILPFLYLMYLAMK